MPRYPDIEPYETGLLDTGDGNLVYWETCGNPDGVPALIVHGGPGSGCTTGNRRSLDPEKYRIILFDQRNCGRSLPHASELIIIEDSGHTGSTTMTDQTHAADDRLYQQITSPGLHA